MFRQGAIGIAFAIAIAESMLTIRRMLLSGIMKTWIKGLLIAGLAFSPLAIIGAVQSGNVIRSLSDKPYIGSHGNEGQRREEMLVKLTTTYVAQGKLVTTPMRNGTQLAPIVFLNAQLELAGAKWRVASIEGITAETFAIS